MVDRITLEKSAFNRNKASNRDAKLNHGCHSYPERQYPISRSVGYLRSTPNVVTPEHARFAAMSSNSAFFVIGYGEVSGIDWDRGTFTSLRLCQLWPWDVLLACLLLVVYLHTAPVSRGLGVSVCLAVRILFNVGPVHCWKSMFLPMTAICLTIFSS